MPIKIIHLVEWLVKGAARKHVEYKSCFSAFRRTGHTHAYTSIGGYDFIHCLCGGGIRYARHEANREKYTVDSSHVTPGSESLTILNVVTVNIRII
jgi:hypothetical protein